MLNKLKLNPNNPRKITDVRYKELKKSIEEFPKMLELRPIVYDESLMVLGGNRRLIALRELVKEKKLKSNPKYFKSVKDFTDKEKRRFVVIDNLVSGTWDDDIIIENWDRKELENWGLNVKDWGNVEGNEEVNPDELIDEDKKITCPKCQFQFEL